MLGVIPDGLGKAALPTSPGRSGIHLAPSQLSNGSRLFASAVCLRRLRTLGRDENLGAAALFSALILIYVRKVLIGPRTIAKATLVIALAVAAGHGLSSGQTGLLRWRWVVAELVTLGASAISSQKLVEDPADGPRGD